MGTGTEFEVLVVRNARQTKKRNGSRLVHALMDWKTRGGNETSQLNQPAIAIAQRIPFARDGTTNHSRWRVPELPDEHAGGVPRDVEWVEPQIQNRARSSFAGINGFLAGESKLEAPSRLPQRLKSPPIGHRPYFSSSFDLTSTPLTGQPLSCPVHSNDFQSVLISLML